MTGTMRLKNKIAVVVGAGQGPGEGLGNGRAVTHALRPGGRGGARGRPRPRLGEGDRRSSAGGDCVAFEADVTREATLAAAMRAAQERWGRLDILHYNVGLSLAGGDASPLEITEEAFDRISAINLRGCVMACKHALPIMRRAALGRHHQHLLGCGLGESTRLVAYKATKAAMIAYHPADRDPERRATACAPTSSCPA